MKYFYRNTFVAFILFFVLGFSLYYIDRIAAFFENKRTLKKEQKEETVKENLRKQIADYEKQIITLTYKRDSVINAFETTTRAERQRWVDSLYNNR